MALPAPETPLLPTKPPRAESPTAGPSVAEPILEEILDSVFAQVEADLKDILPGGANNWSFDVESSGYVPITSPPIIPSPAIFQVERSNGTIDVFDMNSSPIVQARRLEANPIVPQTPDMAAQRNILPRRNPS